MPGTSSADFLSGPCCRKRPRRDPCGPRDLWPCLMLSVAEQRPLLFSDCPLWGPAVGRQGRQLAEQQGWPLGPAGHLRHLRLAAGAVFISTPLGGPGTPAPDPWSAVTLVLPTSCSSGGWAAPGAWAPRPPGRPPWDTGRKTLLPRRGFWNRREGIVCWLFWFVVGHFGGSPFGDGLWRGADKTAAGRPPPRAPVCAALRAPSHRLSPRFRDVRQPCVHNTLSFSTYMYIHIHIHISCGFPFLSFF